LVEIEVKVDGRRQPSLMVMPDELTHLAENGVNRVKGCCPIDFRFEPPPEAFNRIILWGIRRQVFQGDPVVLREKSFDRTTLVNRGIIQDQDQQGLRKPLMELMQKLQKARGCAACGPLPIKALGAQMQRPKQGGTLTLRWRRDFDLLALAYSGDSCHPIQCKAAMQSGGSLPPNPDESCHPIGAQRRLD